MKQIKQLKEEQVDILLIYSDNKKNQNCKQNYLYKKLMDNAAKIGNR